MPGMYRNRVENKNKGNRSKKGKKKKSPQLIIQLVATALFNGYIFGFSGKKLYTGDMKAICVPVLNCYSCPGALGSCPIGSLQAVLAQKRFPFYVLGLLMLFGVVLGRLVCGVLCPFGLVQDLLHKIPLPKLKLPKKLDKALRYLKYVILLLFVIILPVFALDENGVGIPWFCKYICPAGTLGGGIPQLVINEDLRQLVGALFNWKAIVLLAIIVLSIVIARPFCRYLCPLGAFYSLFNRFSHYQMELDKSKCVDCKACEKHCPMAVEVTKQINSLECIRCGKCKSVCPTNAINSGFKCDIKFKRKEKYELDKTLKDANGSNDN